MSRKRVLVVSSNLSTRSVVRVGLEEFGFEVHECNDLPSATSIIEDLVPDAIVVALDESASETLPLLEEWRGSLTQPKSVVAIVNGEAAPEFCPPGIRWLPKPFGLTSLLTALYQSLGLRIA